MVLETKEGESWNKRGTQPCLVLQQGEVRVIHSFIHSFRRDLLNSYAMTGTIPGTKREL